MYKVVKSFKRYKKALKYVAAHLSPENIEEINIVCPGANVEKELIGIAMQSAIGFFLLMLKAIQERSVEYLLIAMFGLL